MIRVQKCLQNVYYSPEVRAFVTLIKTTKVVRLIICKTLDHAQNDPLPRDLRLRT